MHMITVQTIDKCPFRGVAGDKTRCRLWVLTEAPPFCKGSHFPHRCPINQGDGIAVRAQ